MRLAGGAHLGLLKKEPHATTLYLPGQELVLTKSTLSLAGKRYYSHGGSVVAMRTTVAGLTYVLTDHHGTDEVSITASNLYVSRRYMDPFGEQRGTKPSFWPDDKGFVGGVNDATGLVSIGAREYDPGTGRFVSADPILDFGDPQQVHGYAYANNAPATYSDPSGLFQIVDQEGRFRAHGNDWSAEDEKKMNDYYNGNQAVSRVVNDAKNTACKEMRLSSGDCGRMQADAQSNKGFWDVMKEELPDIIGDLTGFNDLRDCFTKFNLMACAGIIPWARVFKLIKSAGRVFNAVRKAIKWEDRVSAARAMMTKWSDRVQELVREGLDKLNDLLPTKAPKVPSCAKHSFPPGRRVLMADGSSKPIEQVELGDTVQAADPETGRTVSRKVVATWVHDDEPERTEVTIDTDGAGGTDTVTLTGTDWHPVWEPKLRAWVPLANLQAGSWLQTSSGTWVQVTEVRHYHGTGKVHDLTVAGAHNYHVLAGTDPVLVHNCGGGSPDVPSGEAIVYLDDDALHASVEVRHGGESLHTERLGMDPNRPTLITPFRGELSANTTAYRIPLPNAGEALRTQRASIGRSGTYDRNWRNCVTHCGDVLTAGGRTDVPMESTAIVSWLKGTTNF